MRAESSLCTEAKFTECGQLKISHNLSYVCTLYHKEHLECRRTSEIQQDINMEKEDLNTQT